MVTIEKLTAQVENKNLLFHYTSYLSALSIVIGNNLRMNSLSKMNDPLEYGKVYTGFQIWGNQTNEEIMELHHQLSTANDNRNSFIRLLSFSVDDLHFDDEVFRKEVFYNNSLNHGWARTRMWAQYADAHKGICLIFNKDKMITYLEQIPNTKAVTGKIKYSNDFSEFNEAMTPTLTEDGINKDFSNFFMEDDKKRFLFQKCDDFLAEQEYRLVLISKSFEKDKPYIFDFKDSLEGIIISNLFDLDNNFAALSKAAEINNLPIFFIEWKHGTPNMYQLNKTKKADGV